MIAWHKRDLENRMYVNVGDGKKACMPRYYKDRIYSEVERSLISEAMRPELEKKAAKRQERFWSERGYGKGIQQHIATSNDRVKRSVLKNQKI